MDWLSSAVHFLAVDYRGEAAFTILTGLLLILPILVYVQAGWRANREDIDNSITAPAKRIYLDRFRQQQTPIMILRLELSIKCIVEDLVDDFLFSQR